MLLKISITDRDIVSAEALTNLIGALRTITDGAQLTLGADVSQGKTITVKPAAKKNTTTKAAKEEPETVKPAEVEKKEPEPEVEDAPEALAEETKDDPEADYKKVREEVRMELAAIARKGKTAEVKKLLEKHGVQKLSDIPDESLGDVLAAAKAL